MGQGASTALPITASRAYIYCDNHTKAYSAGLYFADKNQLERCLASGRFNGALKKWELQVGRNQFGIINIIGILNEDTAEKVATLFDEVLIIEKWWWPLKGNAEKGAKPVIEKAEIDCRKYNILKFSIAGVEDIDHYFSCSFLSELPPGIEHKIWPADDGLAIHLYRSNSDDPSEKTTEETAKRIYDLARRHFNVKSWDKVELAYLDDPVPQEKWLVTECIVHAGDKDRPDNIPVATLHLLSGAAARQCLADERLIKALQADGLKLWALGNDVIHVISSRSAHHVEQILPKHFHMMKKTRVVHDWAAEKREEDRRRSEQPADKYWRETIH